MFNWKKYYNTYLRLPYDREAGVKQPVRKGNAILSLAFKFAFVINHFLIKVSIISIFNETDRVKQPGQKMLRKIKPDLGDG